MRRIHARECCNKIMSIAGYVINFIAVLSGVKASRIKSNLLTDPYVVKFV